MPFDTSFTPSASRSVTTASNVKPLFRLNQPKPVLVAQASSVTPAPEPPSILLGPLDDVKKGQRDINKFKKEVERTYGMKAEALLERLKADEEELEKQLDALALKVDPNATDWRGVKDKLKVDPVSSKAQIQELIAKTPKLYEQFKTFLKKQKIYTGKMPQQLLATNLKDAQTAGNYGGLADETGAKHLIRLNSHFDVDYIKKVWVHEIGHALHFQFSTNQNLSESIAEFFVEQVQSAGWFKPSVGQEFARLNNLHSKLQDSIAAINLSLNNESITEAGNKFYKKTGKGDMEFLASIHERMTIVKQDPFRRMSYYVGAQQLEKLWQQIQASDNTATLNDFLTRLFEDADSQEGSQKEATSVIEFAKKYYPNITFTP
jgi:hypothetical protein